MEKEQGKTLDYSSKIRAAILKNGDRVRLGESILIYYEDMMQRTARCLRRNIILSGV